VAEEKRNHRSVFEARQSKIMRHLDWGGEVGLRPGQDYKTIEKRTGIMADKKSSGVSDSPRESRPTTRKPGPRNLAIFTPEMSMAKDQG